MSSSRRRRFSRSLVKALSLLVLVPLLLTGCVSMGRAGTSSSSSSTSDKVPTFDSGTTMATIQKRGKLIVGVVDKLSPFSYQDPNTGTWKGFDIEVANQIARSIFGNNIEGKVEWIPLDPRDREDALGEQRIDIALSRYTISVARKRYVDFAGPYYTATQDVLLNRPTTTTANSNRITSLVQLNGKKVCVVPGSTNTEALRAVIPAADLSISRATIAACGAELIAGTVDAVAGDHVDLFQYRQAANNSSFTVLANQYGPQPYGIGLHLGDTAFRSFLNTVLEDWKEFSSVYNRTTGDTTTQPEVDRY